MNNIVFSELFLYMSCYGLSELFLETFHIKSIGSRLLYYAVLLLVAFYIHNNYPLYDESPM